IAAAAMRLIDEVEALGGMTRAVESGMPKLRIEESAARHQAGVDRGEEVIVGVNKYQSGEPEHVDILDVANDAVPQSPVARLNASAAASARARCSRASEGAGPGRCA